MRIERKNPKQDSRETRVKQSIKVLFWGLLFLLVLVACQPAPEPTTAPEAVENTATATQAPPTPTPVTPTTTQRPTSTPRPTRTPTQTPEPQPYGPEDFPEGINPLTGLPVPDLELLDRRPVAVKVQMAPRIERPAYGISLADIVFDFYQSFGEIRLTAIFYGQDAEQVSPVRSARLFDGPIVNMYQALFWFGSADPRILNNLYESPVGNQLVIPGNDTCPPMCRVDVRGYNHLAVDTSGVKEFAEKKRINNERPNLDGMLFDPEPPEDGLSGEEVAVIMNRSRYEQWEYDPETGRYLRFQESEDFSDLGGTYEPLMDALTEEQVAADNVVVLFAIHEFAFRTNPGVNEIIEIELRGTGPAVAFRDGQAYEVTWNREELDAPLYLTFSDGTRYSYKPGNTWYQVIGQASDTVKPGEGDADWQFHFFMP